MYFYLPTRVKFFAPFVNDEKNVEKGWNYGIGYKDEIICGCCGDIFTIKYIYEDAEDFDIPKEEAIKELGTWINLTNEIKGK